MSDSEKEILKRIKDNPFISQRELAEAIGLSTQRSKHYFRINTKGICYGKGICFK